MRGRTFGSVRMIRGYGCEPRDSAANSIELKVHWFKKWPLRCVRQEAKQSRFTHLSCVSSLVKLNSVYQREVVGYFR
jgi:hypothetical protein